MKDDLRNAPLPPRPLTAKEVAEWLEYQMEPLRSRRDDIIMPALHAMAAAYPEIADGDEETAGQFAENLAMARELVRQAEAAHKREKEPYLTGGRAVDGWKAKFLTTLAAGMEPLSRILLDFANRKEARERIERQKEAARLAEEARQAIVANAFGEETTIALDQARRAQRDAAARPAEMSQSRGSYGAVASIRQTWSWEVTDPELVPRELLMIDPQKMREKMHRKDNISGRPLDTVPGIKWVPVRSLGVR
jgi:hypothetical protein